MTDDEIRMSHLIDDNEKIRTHAIRTLNDVLPLLADALHAIDHTNPDVAREFVDRVHHTLTAELTWHRNQ